MIRERWKQFLFGFYPVDLYWRPTLAFVLMLVALAPMLFSERAAQAAAGSRSPSPASPTGCSGAARSCVPIAIYAGFVVGYLACRFAARFGSSLLSR